MYIHILSNLIPYRFPFTIVHVTWLLITHSCICIQRTWIALTIAFHPLLRWSLLSAPDHNYQISNHTVFHIDIFTPLVRDWQRWDGGIVVVDDVACSCWENRVGSMLPSRRRGQRARCRYVIVEGRKPATATIMSRHSPTYRSVCGVCGVTSNKGNGCWSMLVFVAQWRRFRCTCFLNMLFFVIRSYFELSICNMFCTGV